MDEIERRLRKYRPVGPPPELRVFALRPNRTPLVAWLPAIAAAMAIMVCGTLKAGVDRRVSGQLSAAAASRAAAVDDLAERLEGDPFARQVAERAISIEPAAPAFGAEGGF